MGEEEEVEEEEVEEEEVPDTEPILGVDCSKCVECTFPEMECWQDCFNCILPYCEHDDWECIGMAMEES